MRIVSCCAVVLLMALTSSAAFAQEGSKVSIDENGAMVVNGKKVFPIGFTPDGSKLYFATLNAQGSDVYVVAPDGSNETKIAHLSDEITREWALMLGGGRALMLQAAHPLALAGVIEHSDYERDVWGRLRGTMAYVWGVVYGSEEDELT